MFGYHRFRKTAIRPHRRGGVTLVLVLTLLLLALPAAAADFLEAVEDLPLAPGLVEDREAAMVFDKPGGRIVEARASGRRSPSAVAAFYGETLPQLGWALEPDGGTRQAEGTVLLRFTRAQELLSLVIGERNGEVIVRFAITPR